MGGPVPVNPGPPVHPPHWGINLIKGQVDESNWQNTPAPPVTVHVWAAPDEDYFAPRDERWHWFEIVPVSGFMGRNHRNDWQRNGRHGQNPTSVRGDPRRPEHYDPLELQGKRIKKRGFKSKRFYREVLKRLTNN